MEVTCSQDFHVDALEKFVEESSVPTVTIFNNDPSNHPFVIKFFNNPNAKVIDSFGKFVDLLRVMCNYYPKNVKNRVLHFSSSKLLDLFHLYT